MRRLCQPGAKCLGRSPRGDVWEFKEPLARITRTAIEGGAVLPDWTLRFRRHFLSLNKHLTTFPGFSDLDAT
ncbi:hypothetical protein DIPPA_07426 [Diplonema papillatum]|nr:hypothetical protein DIPPA_19933 [Diplonema papillatum]KAJ9451290.1 hypothetical protein DIPPA_07426 [Diplonema papillatum]